MAIGVLAPYGKVQYFDDNGDPLAGGKLYAYAAGTTNAQDTYTEYSLTTPNANPVVLDAAGRATVFLGASPYKLVLKNSADATVWTVDNIVAKPVFANVLSKTGDYTVAAADGEDLLVNGDASTGSFTLTLYASANHAGNRITVKKTDSTTNKITIDGNLAELVDDASTFVLGIPNEAVTLECTGSGWKIVAYFQAENPISPAISSGALTLDMKASTVFEVSLNANITSISFTNPPASGLVGFGTVIFTADGTPRTVTFAAADKFAGGLSYTPTSTNGKKDILTFFTLDGGTTRYWSIVGQNF